MSIKVIESNAQLNQILASKRAEGQKLGFVPTMGALHNGHLSLIQQALQRTEFVICSIFVNPTQFNNSKDLENYPRTIEADVKKLEKIGCNLVFVPTFEAIYENEAPFEFDFKGLDSVMEGANRPGHFKGVVRVVKRLFEIVKPDIAFFGLKDFQQFAIIKELVRQFEFPIELVGCETVREPSGLAMSSRNLRLSETEIEKAKFLYKALEHLKGCLNSNNMEVCLQEAKQIIGSHAELEYLEIADKDFLQPVENIHESPGARAFVAAHVGEIRLIDNMEVN